MALSAQSLILYGYTISANNQNLDFVAVSGGPILTAQIPFGEYSLTTLLAAVQTALSDADTTSGQVYTASSDRSLMGGTQNRVTIAASGGASGTFLSLLFGTGPNSQTSIAETIGFNEVNNTGSTSYTGNFSTGTSLIPAFIGYNYADQMQQAKVFGAVNISASGLKEAVVFNEQYFIDVEYRYELKANLPNWVAFRDWAITQSPFDFTPEISSPNTYYPVTLEKSQYGTNGLGFLMKEMLPDFPNEYSTGPINMRVVIDYGITVYLA